jgi:hypothetical protein
MRNNGIWDKIIIYLLSSTFINFVFWRIKCIFYTWTVRMVLNGKWKGLPEIILNKLKLNQLPVVQKAIELSVGLQWPIFLWKYTEARCLGWILKSLSFGWLFFSLFVLECLFIVLWHYFIPTKFCLLHRCHKCGHRRS